MNQPQPSAILRGTGRAVPDKVLSNNDFETFLDTSDEWITTRTGIKERRIADSQDTTASLGAEAARRAIDNAGIDPEQIDLLINATITPEMVFPATACVIQHELGLRNDCAAFDVSAACSGFLYSMAIANQFIRGGVYRTALIIGSEVLSRFTDYEDRGSCILFGDGAGAAIFQAGDEADRGVKYTFMAAEGAGWELLYVPAGGSRIPTSHKTVDARQHFIHINGREIYKFAVSKMQWLMTDVFEKCGVGVDDIAMVVPHQVNQRIIDSACTKLGFPGEKVYMNIDRYGNTSAASIPIALDEARSKGTIRTGDLVLMVAFGAGLTWASALVRV